MKVEANLIDKNGKSFPIKKFEIRLVSKLSERLIQEIDKIDDIIAIHWSKISISIER